GLSVLVNALAAAGDIVIAFSLCWLLHKSRTGFSKSNRIIDKLILFTVNTGLLTSLCAIASLTSIIVAGHTYLYIAFFFCIGRLYTNSLLVTLNAREMIRSSSRIVNATNEDHFSVRLTEQRRTKANAGGETLNWTTDLAGNVAQDSQPELGKASWYQASILSHTPIDGPEGLMGGVSL
ncbi:hypothetical protein CVT26_008297, partial [Gymnopilus dilepis]